MDDEIRINTLSIPPEIRIGNSATYSFSGGSTISVVWDDETRSSGTVTITGRIQSPRKQDAQT